MIKESTWVYDEDFFSGKTEFKHTLTDDLKKMENFFPHKAVVTNDDQMYAIRGALIYHLAQELDNIFTETDPHKKAQAMGEVREFFQDNNFWWKAEEPEEAKKLRKQGEWEREYRNRGDNFTGD